MALENREFDFIQENFDVKEWRHLQQVSRQAKGIARHSDALSGFRFYRPEIIQPGGRKSLIADPIAGERQKSEWREKRFKSEIVIG